MWSTTLILTIMLAILASLGLALYRLLLPGTGSARGVLRALSWRITLAFSLFALLMIGFRLGYLHPHGLPTKPAEQTEVN